MDGARPAHPHATTELKSLPLLLYYAQTDLFAILMLLILLLNMRRVSDLKSQPARVFSLLVWSIILNIAADFAAHALDGFQSAAAIQAAVVLLFMLNPVTAYLWFLYTDYYLFGSEERLRKLALPAAAPLADNAVFALLNPWTGLMFTLDEGNAFHNGKFIIVLYASIYIYLLAAMVQLIHNRKKLAKGELLPMLLYALPPFAGSLVQANYYKVLLIWPLTALSLLVIYTFVQSKTIHTDHLTNLFNRREFDKRLAELADKKHTDNLLAGIVLDIDNFKQINDRYGHKAGDSALRAFCAVMRDSFRQYDFVARTGGDEFAVILELKTATQLDRIIRRLQANVDAFNKTGTLPFPLSVSTGSGLYDPSTVSSPAVFFEMLDARMYENKKKKKQEG